MAVMKAIDEGASKIALVVDGEGKLLGTVTDGDIRRAIIRSIGLDQPVEQIMNRNPTTASSNTPGEVVIATLRQHSLQHMPLLDSEGRVEGLVILDELVRPRLHDNVVVLMAGGRGSRLQPLTDDCPKPMLSVGGRPLLETILLRLIEFGSRRFYLSVNYKAEVIERHFGDGSAWGVDIRYLREPQPLGTAGSLSLLPELPEKPLIVMNGDLLANVNFDEMVEFHTRQGSKATMAVRDYHFEVPYGVVKLKDFFVMEIAEKPVHHFFVNAGVYVLDPQVLSHIPRQSYFDMPMLLQEIMARHEQVTAFPLREYCLDVGRPDDFRRANIDFEHIFS
jgi:dTDP-glucose pyrophosphorylase